MKKLIALTSALMLLVSCAKTDSTTSQELPDYNEYYESVSSQSLILPEDVEIVEADADEWFHSFMKYGFTVSDINGNYTYGTYSDFEEEKRYEAVYDITTDEFIELVELEETNMSYPLEEDDVDVSDIIGLDRIVDPDAMYNVERSGNYIVFRAGNTLTAYVCEIRDDSVNVVAKGSSVGFGVTDDCIFFTNYPDFSSSKMKLYILKIETGEIVEADLPMPFEETHVSGLKSTSDGGIRVILNVGESSYSLEEYVYYMTQEDIDIMATELF